MRVLVCRACGYEVTPHDDGLHWCWGRAWAWGRWAVALWQTNVGTARPPARLPALDELPPWWDRPEWAEDPNEWAAACEEVAALLEEPGPMATRLGVPAGSVRVVGRTSDGRLLYSQVLAPSVPEEPGTRPVVEGDASAYLAWLDLVSRELGTGAGETYEEVRAAVALGRPPPPDVVRD